MSSPTHSSKKHALSEDTLDTTIDHVPSIPKKPKTLVDIQRSQVEKLMERVEKPIELPESSRNSSKMKLKPPPEIVRNVMGSSAGAGSGEFHVYRALRRKEQMRQKIMDEEVKEEEEQREYEEKMKRIREEEERKTAKKRDKRRKRNQKKGDKKTEQTAPSESQADSGSDQ